MTTMCNFILHLEHLTVYYVCKVFFQNGETVQFLSVRVDAAADTEAPSFCEESQSIFKLFGDLFFMAAAGGLHPAR